MIECACGHSADAHPPEVWFTSLPDLEQHCNSVPYIMGIGYCVCKKTREEVRADG